MKNQRSLQKKNYNQKRYIGNNRSTSDYGSRIRLIKMLSVLWVFLIIGRLYVLQVANPTKWTNWANKQHMSKVKLAGERGRILDTNNNIMATSVPAASVFIRPDNIKDKNAVKELLLSSLEMDSDYLDKKLNSSEPFVWIKRQIPTHIAKQIKSADLKGVNYLSEPRRYYPYKGAASQLIGKVGVDGNGLLGIEARYENNLNSEIRTVTVRKDALGKRISDYGIEKNGEAGESLQLTIDAELQLIADEEVEKARILNEAKRAVAIMLDPETGEILSISQSPSINFNNEKISDPRNLTNFAVEASYEPGSTMKPLVAAIAIDREYAKPADRINTEKGRFKIGRHTIKDVHPDNILSVSDIVIRSSNVGMSKLGFLMGKDVLYESLKEYGFGKRTNLRLPGEGSGILRNVKNWSKVDVATHSFGQGIAVTPIQMMRGYAALVNGGYLPDLKIVKDNAPTIKRKIISEETSDIIKQIMVQVVEDEHGTGGKVRIPGLMVGGKTGTAQKARVDGRGYEKGAYLASFVGFADAKSVGLNKQLVLGVFVDEPRAGSIYGGTVAGPAFRKIIKRSLHTLLMRQQLWQDKEEVPPSKSGIVKVSY